MIVPVPAAIMDLLLALSITSALLMLFVGIYTIKPLDFSVFPSLLLMITSSVSRSHRHTRLILLHGNEAPRRGGLIESFGTFVVAAITSSA